jgi:DNA-binding transcriptional LysR family regulator
VINLHRLDLNLLRTLDVLLSEHNVTRAAQRLNLSQPSVSIQLARLRDIFADPLLLPGPRGMLPTARADELRGPLRDALTALELAVAPASHFDRRRRRRPGGWRPRIIWPRRFCSRRCTRCVGLPGSRLAVFELQPSRLVSQAERDEVDLFFHTRDGAPAELHQRLLFSERYVLAGRAGHPALRAPLSLAQFCQLDQVIVSPTAAVFMPQPILRWPTLGFRGGLSFRCHISCLCWRRCAIAIWWRWYRSGWRVG